MTLVDGRDLEKVGCWSDCGSASFRAPCDSWNAVGQGAGGKVAHGNLGCKDVVVGNGASEFEVAIGDGA